MSEAIILGIIQGLTEYLPVSSTAHLILYAWITGAGGMMDTLTFDVALHIGTLAAVVVYFSRDWIEMITIRKKLFLLVVLAAIPAGIAGFFLNDLVETTLRSPLIIACALILVAFIMWASERFQKTRDIESITPADALSIGCAQVLALIPGVSRSGITISAGLFRNITRESAARFSFLLSTPIIAGAALLHTLKILRSGADFDAGIFLAGIVSSGVSGFVAI
ncbi:MAG: undecaprenyl-diphosphate phosphatase, partial [bacterium]